MVAFALAQGGGAVIWSALTVYQLRLPGLFPLRADLRLLRHLASEMERAPPEQRAARIAELSRDLELDLAWVHADGSVIVAAGNPLPPADPGQLARTAGAPRLLGLGPRPMFAIAVDPAATSYLLTSPASLTPREFPLRVVLAVTGSLLVALLILVPVTRSITRPLSTLERAAEAFGRGELDARTGLEGRDELGHVGQAFDHMADQVTRARQLERELLANASHELKTPLARLRMALALVDRGSPEVSRRLEALDLELDGLTRLVTLLLDLSRLEVGSLSLRHESVDLSALLRREVENAKLHGSQRSFELEGETAPKVGADPALLRRAIANLLENADRYDRSGGAIRVRARAIDGAVEIAIVDHGPGTTPEERARLFAPFQRGAAGLAESGGSGLGLAFVRRVARLHGGDAWLEDTPGGGATAVIRLPREANTTSMAPAS
jgi:signal transduction histidine kinase